MEPCYNLDDLNKAISDFRDVPDSYHADIVQRIGMELFISGKLTQVEFHKACLGLFDSLD